MPSTTPLQRPRTFKSLSIGQDSFSSGGFFVVVVDGFFFSGCGLIFLACSGGLYKYIYIYIDFFFFFFFYVAMFAVAVGVVVDRWWWWAVGSGMFCIYLYCCIFFLCYFNV